MNFRRLFNSIPIWIGAISLIAVSCGDDGSPTGGGGGGGGGDTTPPGIASVTAVDERHIEVEFDEDVKKETAERRGNYIIVEQTTPSPLNGVSSPGDTIHVSSVALDSDMRTAILTTENPMNSAPYNCTVSGVEDENGNRIVTGVTSGFTGTTAGDTTPPMLVFRQPAPNETGVGIGQSVIVQFSEGMDRNSVNNAFSWTGPGGAVPFEMDEEDDNRYVFVPLIAMNNNTTYNVALSSAAIDWAGNPLAAANWSFTTTASVDNTRPSLDGTTPANGATNVSVATNLQLRFSEPINQYNEIEIFITPEIDNGVLTWTNGGATLNFDPDMDLLDDTQYRLIIPEGAVTDLAGNGLDTSYEIVFTTGSTFFSGSIEGTLTGDPSSASAASPEGAIVIVADRNPFGDSNDDGLSIAGSAIADGNGDYDVNFLPDGWFFPVALLDSNNDGQINPEDGDAVGAFGADLSQGDGQSDSVQVAGGNTINNVDFNLYDPCAITGVASYAGTMYLGDNYQIFVHAFDTTGFNPASPQPDFDADAYYPDNQDYRFSEFDDNLDRDMTYYVGAYMDVNNNQTYDTGTDPIGWYENGSGLIPITVENGSDALDINFMLSDPVIRANVAPWQKSTYLPTAKQEARKQLLRFINRALEAHNR